MKKYETHKFAEIFPMLDDSELKLLADDIKQNGLINPIVLFEKKILDGRNRYRACEIAKISPDFIDYIGPDALKHVIGLNLHRRHLTTSQRSSIASEVENMQQGRPGIKDANLHVKRKEAAKLLNVSPRSVADAAKVKDESPELHQSVKLGNISVSLAKQILDLPEESKREILAAAAKDQKDVALEKIGNHRTIGGGQNEWYTPAEYVDAARKVLGGIDLDPASCPEANETVKAKKIHTQKDDGLKQKWKGRVWMNPPYSRDLMPAFVKKLLDEYKAGNVAAAVMISHNNTDTAWFHSLGKECAAICFAKQRVKFYRGDEIAAPTNGQAFFYLGDDPGKFRDIFEKIGLVVKPI